MKLIICNKNYSSWSLRGWLLLRELGIDFEEEKLSFNDPEWKKRVLAISPAGRVPILVDGDLVVWDTIAIAEHVAERHPDKNVWPADPAARALARSVCAEMHAGFTNLKNNMPMNISGRFPGLGWNIEVQDDIDRIIAIWTNARERFGSGGDMLFGGFSAADAFYAPVVWRFVTHEVELPPVAAAYVEAMRALPSMQDWERVAREEDDFIAMDEPYRRGP